MSVAHSELSRSVENSVQHMQHNSNVLAFVKVYQRLIPCSTKSEELEHLVETFFSSLNVVTKHDLQSLIVLKESDNVIGRMKSGFYLQSSEAQSTLCIDDKFDDEEDIFAEIVEHLYNDIAEKLSVEVPMSTKRKSLNFLKKYFKARPAKKQEILKKYGIETNVDQFTLELGDDIPEHFYHQLDQDPHMSFLPMEYVGYEVRKDHFVVARVGHLLSEERVNQLAAIYRIYINNQDSEGKDVSILDLYKFAL